MTTLTIPLPKKEKDRLSRLALRYGLSLPEFSRRILKEITSNIPEESFEDYDNPKELKESFKQAFRDFRAGRVYDRL
jgi:hypothetical protein